MKKLYLGNGIKLIVAVEESDNARTMIVYNGIEGEEVYRVIKHRSMLGIQAKMQSLFIEWNEISEINEISENFDRYFNQINQK